jgi:glyoxylate carboligase
MNQQITGAEALMRSLEHQGVKTLFGYPGGSIMPTFDALYGHRDTLNHILVRHEQGATHAAQGFANRGPSFPLHTKILTLLKLISRYLILLMSIISA